VIAKGYRVSLCGDDESSKIVVMATHIYAYTKTYSILYFK